MMVEVRFENNGSHLHIKMNVLRTAAVRDLRKGIFQLEVMDAVDAFSLHHTII
jgi:hypothetical protein